MSGRCILNPWHVAGKRVRRHVGGLGRREDARWSGALEVIPTRAYVVLDLIRVNSLWPLLPDRAIGPNVPDGI